MRFIHYHGKVIAIKDKASRTDAAATSVGSGVGGGLAVAGLSKLGARAATKEAGLTKLARKSTAQAEKAAKVLEYAIQKKKAGPKFTASAVDRITRNIARTEKLLSKAAGHTLAKVALRRTAVIGGGIAIGHSINTAIHAVTGKEPDTAAKGASHLTGISIAAIASGMLMKGAPGKIKHVQKVLRMVRK